MKLHHPNRPKWADVPEVDGMLHSMTHHRTCPECHEQFAPGRWEHRNYAQRFCSRKCSYENRSARKRANWPSEGEMRRLVFEEKLSDAQIGAIYAHSYEWARQVRNAYSIPALPKPPHREVKHGRYSGKKNWTVKAKGEPRCRNCKAEPTGRGPLGALHLHHVIPRSMNKAASLDLRNGIPLCCRCHAGWHDRVVVIYRDVFSAEEWDYLTSVQLFGQNVLAWLEDNYPAKSTERL